METMKTIVTRRSVRSYKTEQIPEEFTPLFAIALGYRADEAPEKTLEQRITVSRV